MLVLLVMPVTQYIANVGIAGNAGIACNPGSYAIIPCLCLHAAPFFVALQSLHPSRKCFTLVS